MSDQPSSTVTLLRRVDAELFESEMKTGRNGAVLLSARCDDGTLVQSIVKLSARLERPPTEYLREWLASAIARRLGIDTPEPLAVTISPEFAASIFDSRIRADVAKSAGVAFGSTFAGPALTQWKATDSLPPELRDQAIELMVFDAMIHNIDRRRENPNLLAGRDRIVAIDHELSFVFLDPLSPPSPELDPLASLRDSHVFGRAVGPRIVFSLERIRAAIEAMDDEFLSDIQASTPIEWTRADGGTTLSRALEVMRGRRTLVATWLPQVNAWIRK